MPDVQGSIGSTTLNSLGTVSQIAFSALSGTECGYVASEIIDEYSRNRYITKKVNYIYYKAILDVETIRGSHWQPFLKMAAISALGQICDVHISKNPPMGIL